MSKTKTFPVMVTCDGCAREKCLLSVECGEGRGLCWKQGKALGGPGLYDAAVNILAHEALSAESAGRNDITLSILSALALLEAAGRVDREKAIDDLDDAISIVGHGALDSVMAMLAAMPEVKK